MTPPNFIPPSYNHVSLQEPQTMPPKGKPTSADPKTTDSPPETLSEQSKHRYHLTNPLEKKRSQVGFAGLPPAEKKTYAHTNLILPVSQYKTPISNKAEREFWKHVTKESLPIRRLPRERHDWGTDKSGRDIGTYKLSEFQERQLKQAKLASLELLHRQFLTKRRGAYQRGEKPTVSSEDLEAEKNRRREMAALRKQLYGDEMGALEKDPEWDDVVPIPQHEVEGALAQIAYPEDYAEAVAYLRAVMAAEEYSARCLRLTSHVISMNPAHYTVWLYRFKILTRLPTASLADELAWLNDVALRNLKNYQIWHHRQLLMEHYLPALEEQDPAAEKQVARDELAFIRTMLEEDTKNYHVWSYRQFLVERMGLFTPTELAATQSLIEEDVRNNSAWSHRFFLVFSDPTQSTPNTAPTAHDPAVPETVIDRELNYAKEKILLAPQNQSAWNYYRGVLTKGGRSLASTRDFAKQFAEAVGEEGEKVTSSHALDFLAEMHKEKGETKEAEVCWKRLAEKWDPVREGYWNFQIRQLST